MNQFRFLPSIAVFFLIAASCEKATLLAQKIPGYGPNAKACALLPISDLEAFYHGKTDTPRGFDDESGGSICSVSIAGQLAKVQTAAPGIRELRTPYRGALRLSRRSAMTPKAGPSSRPRTTAKSDALIHYSIIGPQTRISFS